MSAPPPLPCPPDHHIDPCLSIPRAARLLHTLDHLYQAQSLPLGASLRPDSSPVDRALRLRAVLDDVAEQLPPLLELAAGSPGEYDFPYHRPSVLSTATVDPRPLPECVGRVLLEVSPREVGPV